MKSSLYWIRHKDHTNIFSEGYVGVSTNIEARFQRHSRYSDNQHLKAAIKKYGWENLVKQIVLIAEESYCYAREFDLRPKEQIGWNIALGGAKPPVSKPRGTNYVSPLKGVPRPTPWNVGRVKTDKERKNIAEARKQKVKFQDIVYNSFEDLAAFLGIKYSTLTNRIYRNATKYGYEVLK
jgi:predicted GIY-YIG superfamily endonuclease